MFILWQDTLTRLKSNAFKVNKKQKTQRKTKETSQNGLDWFKLSERTVTSTMQNYVLHLNLTYKFLSHRIERLGFVYGFHLVHLPSSRKYQPCFQNLANLELQLLSQVHQFLCNGLCLMRTNFELTSKNRRHCNAKPRVKAGQMSLI